MTERVQRQVWALPTIAEIEGADNKALKAVNLKGGYKSIEEYTRTYAKLTREDFLSQVRRGLRQYRKDRLKREKERNFELEIAEEIKFGHQVPCHTGLNWQVYINQQKVNFRLVEKV